MVNLGNAALRLVSGAFILNSGIGKLGLSEEAAAGLQAQAEHAIPQFSALTPAQFGKLLCFTEIGVGSALLLPFVPSRLAGVLLGGFSSGLFTMYLRSPGTTEPDGIRPTGQGVAYAKDVWLVGIAAALILNRKRK